MQERGNMTIKELIERKRYVKRAIAYKFYRLPGVWRLLGEKHIPKVKSANGKMVPFGQAAEEALDIYDGALDVGKKKTIRQDMMRAWYKNLVTPEEYSYFEFIPLSQRERDKFVSRKEKDQRMCLHVGIGDNYLLLKDKYKFYNKFSAFFHRDVCLLTKQEADILSFKKFCKVHGEYIAKNNKGRMGMGTVIRAHDGSDDAIDQEAKYLFSQGEEWVVEELIHQDERISALNSSSVNTVRVCSRWNSDGFAIFETVIRMGRKGAIVDNVSSGGITAVIDPNTGIVISDAVDKCCHFYPKHPDSLIEIKGFQIPEWDSLKKVAYQIHAVIPYYPYIGWDFALSDKGWVVVEGNWGNFISQYILKRGIRKEFDKCFR